MKSSNVDKWLAKEKWSQSQTPQHSHKRCYIAAPPKRFSFLIKDDDDIWYDDDDDEVNNGVGDGNLVDANGSFSANKSGIAGNLLAFSVQLCMD